MDLDLTEKVLSACSGSILTSLLVTPLDVVKVRMQSQSKTTPTRPTLIFHGDFFDNVEPSKYNASSSGTSATPRYMPKSAQQITGTFSGLRYIVENEGAHSLWRGLSPTLMMAVPATIVYFVGYESLRNRLAMKSEAMAPLIAGAGARILAATMISPLELVRTNMQHLGPDGTVRTVLGQVFTACRSQGLGVLFKGLVPTLWRDVPFSAIYWSGFETTRRWLRPKIISTTGLTDPTSEFAVSFLAGGISGAVAAAATTPFDVAKTRTQVQISSPTDTTLAALRPRPGNILRQLVDIWRAEGTAGLFMGISPRVFKVAPACAIMIGSYECCKAFFFRSKQAT